MRNEKELKRIAAGVMENKITKADDLSLKELDQMFPKLMDMTLREAAHLLEDNVRVTFQWNSKKETDGTFSDWEYLNEEEWEFITEIMDNAPPRPRRPKKKRRIHRGKQKATKN